MNQVAINRFKRAMKHYRGKKRRNVRSQAKTGALNQWLTRHPILCECHVLENGLFAYSDPSKPCQPVED